MIEAIAAFIQLAMFVIWNKNDWINVAIKTLFLFSGLALTFESLREFGFIVNV